MIDKSNFLNRIYTIKEKWVHTHLNNPQFDKKMQIMKDSSFCFSPLFSRQSRFIVIAEVKQASPSEGLLHHEQNFTQRASDYEKAGASALSVLTEETYFKGHPSHLQTVQQQVQVPCLMKDFIIDPRQIFFARLCGAQIILLIVALLSDELLHSLYQLAIELGLNVLVEIHDLNDWQRARSLSPHLIGMNNRCLSDLSVDLQRSFDIINSIQSQSPIISESGIQSIDEVLQLKEAGFSGILIGSTLMKRHDYASFLSDLVQSSRETL